MVQSDVHAEGTREVLRAGLEGAEGELLLVNPSREMVRELVDTYSEPDSLPPVRLFVDERPMKDLTDDFLVASNLADLVDGGSFEIRTLSAVPRHSLLLTAEFVVSVVQGEAVAGLTTRDEEFVSSTYGEYERRWEEAKRFSLRTPPLSEIRESLEAEIGPDAVADFDRIVQTLETGTNGGNGLDEVTIALLVAANNGELLYDISRWGEDIRLASKATFSRNKNRLEEAGLIDTEKVPIDVGRPRLRLLLNHGAVQAPGIEEVAQQAKKELT